ncbi:Hypothetical predicted protein [Lecanosticta acicola]|uniref:Uncharacterized protein n=1 Tax=Lecanosticta acicola TaxID=111012 RepID=A0AAI8YXB8_9PEZI|nr:Hypothetical predicted protein [Lecanosticta acicola]
MSEDYKKAQDRLAQEAKDPSQNEIQTGGTQSSMLKERPRKREMRAPEFCDCGEHSRTYPTQAGRSGFRIRLAPLAARKDPQHTARSVDASNSKDKVATPQATHCGRCKKLKVPKSRRPAFLKKWHQDNSRSSEDNDGDDEEVPPRPVPDMNDQAQDGVHGNEEIAADGSTIEGRSRVDEPQPSMESSATAIAFQSSGEVPGTTAIEATQVTITPSSAASPQTETTNEQASAAAPSAPPESLSTGVSSPQAIAYSSEDPAISLEGGAQISEREDMSKRPAEEPVEDRPAKHQRIDIDLTGDDVAMVKTEHKAEGKGKNMLKTQEINDKEELEARLQDIRMRKEELQLKREEAEVQRQLRELEKRAGRPTRESGGIIKIED